MEKLSISDRLAALKSSAPVQPLPDSTASALRCNLVKSVIKYQLHFTDYKLLAEWLGCYKCILPVDRILLTAIPSTLLDKCPAFRARDVFKVWLLCDLIETTLSHSEQLEILSWTQEYNY